MSSIDSVFVVLTAIVKTTNSPALRNSRFSPIDEFGNSKLVFLGSEKGFDTHFGHMGFHSIDWKGEAADMSSEKELVKQRWDIRDATASKDIGIVGTIPFPGLALVGLLPENGFVSSDTMVMSTMWGSSVQIVRVNVHSGKVRLIRTQDQASQSEPYELTSQDLLCVTPTGDIIVKETSPNKPGAVGYITNEQLLKDDVAEVGASVTPVASFSPLASSSCSSVPSSVRWLSDYSYQILTLERPSGNNKWSAPIQCILMLPSKQRAKGKPPPMIVLPHGGPHSVSTPSFVSELGGFLCGHAGYALLLVNYRGSIGFGQAAVEDLPSRIGDLDVLDVVHAVKHVAKTGLVDPERLAICGGSHGGFLTGHCIGQFPDLFKAACMRNPVTNIATMTSTTDIPDWAVIEACGLGKYDWKHFTGPSAEQLTVMYNKSPIAHSHKVKTPTLMALGTKDLRVPPSQGLEYYHVLRSKGVETKLLLYDDCDHPIGAVCSKADHWINIKRWFDKHVPP